MKNILIIIMLLIASCITSSARSWHVEDVDNAVSEKILQSCLNNLDSIWSRWPVSFKIEPIGTDGLIEINYITYGNTNTIGRAYPGAKRLKGPNWGIFYKRMELGSRNMTDEQMGLWLANTISHEIGHAYGLIVHEGCNCLMNSIVPKNATGWSTKSIKHLDDVLGKTDKLSTTIHYYKCKQ